jgi:hypothetical protein
MLATCLVFSSMAQTGNPKKNSPKEDIKVNREYDEQGNLIRFDSTYTYNWSSDSTRINEMMPENFNHFFDDQFKLFNDSTAGGNSFFRDFDLPFDSPFSSKHDSLLMKKFGMDNFRFFNFDGDSLHSNFKDFDDLLGQMEPNKKDSITSGHKTPGKTTPHSTQDMLKMIQQQMKEMEEFQRKFFKE